MRQWILVRHGETDWNSTGRMQGQTDVPLNDLGRAQIQALARYLANTPIDAILTSDLGRSRETAEAIAAYHHGLAVQPDPRLREISMGQWEGWTSDEISAKNPVEAERRRADPTHYAPPGGESSGDLAIRLRSLMEELERRDNQTIVLSSHGMALRVLICLALDIPVDRANSMWLENASISTLITHKGRIVLATLNDTSHLNGLRSGDGAPRPSVQ